MMHNSIKYVMFVSLIVLGAGGYLAAGEQVCNGSLPAGTYANVRVPQNASCHLGSGVVITGNFAADRAADIHLNSVTIEGNLTVDRSNGSSLYITDSIINKNVSITNSSYSTNLNINGSQIGGNVTLLNNSVNVEDNPPFPGTFDNSVGISSGTVGGNVNVSENRAFHFIFVESPAIKGNLTMNDNFSIANIVYCAFTNPANLTMLNNTGGGTTDIISTPIAVAAFFNNVVGNATISGNVGLGGSSIDLEDLTVGKNLTCNNNDPTPTFGILGGAAPTAGKKINCAVVPFSP